MITQNLVELIESGQAQYKNWIIGATGSSRIPVPKNSYIVITDFTYHHFIDRDVLTDPIIISQILTNAIHNLSFTSYGQKYIYGIRTVFDIIFNDGIQLIMPKVPSTHYDTYQVHKTDVHVDIWRIPNFNLWSPSFSKLDDKTTEAAGPTGYGTQNNGPNQNVTRKVDLTGFQTDFLPYGENQGLPLNQGWREQFYGDIDNNTALFQIDKNKLDCLYTFPLMNVGYVLINKSIKKTDR